MSPVEVLGLQWAGKGIREPVGGHILGHTPPLRTALLSELRGPWLYTKPGEVLQTRDDQLSSADSQ